MTSTLQLSIRWRDEFIKWNNSVYSNTLSFKSTEIWVPDIIVSNNVNNFKFDLEKKVGYSQSHSNIYDFSERNKYFIMIDSNGDCRWVFPLKVLTICELNQDNFPFDVQQCHIDFRSSAFNNDLLALETFGSGIHLKLINEAEFDLINASTSSFSQKLLFNVEIEKEISLVRLTLLMRRKILYYMNKLIMPYFFFYIVALLTYIVPVESGEKKSYSTSILISGMMYLKDISDLIPKTGHLPILSVYFNLNLVLMSICISLTTVIYLVYYNYKSKKPLVGCLKKLVQHSRYVTDEKKLFKTNLSNYEMENIRKRLIDLNKNLFLLDESVSDSGQHEKCLENLIGNEVLGFVKALKMYIIRKNDLETSTRKNMFTKENVANSKYLNTLESLKFNLTRSEKRKNKKIDQEISLNQKLDALSNGLMESNKAKIYLESLQIFKASIKNYITSIKKANNIRNFTRYLQNQMNNDQILVHQWKYLAMLIDRFVFLFFGVVTPISLLLMYLKVNNSLNLNY